MLMNTKMQKKTYRNDGTNAINHLEQRYNKIRKLTHKSEKKLTTYIILAVSLVLEHCWFSNRKGILPVLYKSKKLQRASFGGPT